MARKISTIVDDKVWREFQAHAQECSRSLSGLLTEAMQEYLRRRRIRPEFLKHAEDSLRDYETLGHLLAR